MTAATTLSKGVSEEITPDANLQTSSKEEEREGEGGEAAAAGSTAEDQTPISNSVQSAHYRPAPTVKLYVGNLDTRVVDEDLQRLFPLACSVKIVIPATPAAANGETTSAASSSTKPNFGFIEFQHQSDAHTALNATNGTRLYDLDIKVNWAFANGNKPHSSSSSSHYHVFVGDLGPEVDDGMLIKEFGGFPSLSEARVMWDSTSGKSRGYGFVAFRDRAEADQCIETMNGRQLGTRAIRCNWANQKVSSAFSSSSAGSAASQQQHYHQPHTSKYNRYQNGSGGGGGYNSHHLNSGSSSPGGAHIGNSHLYYVPPEAGVLKYEDVVVQTSTYNTTVYVGNLSPQTTETDLNEAFIQFGNIIDMKSQFDRGFAFIKFDNHDSAAFAIVTNNAIELQGRPMKCSWGKDRTPGYNGGGVGSYRHNNNGNYGAVGATGGVAGIHNPYIAQMSFQGMHPDAHQMTGYPPEAFAYSPTGAYSPYGFYYPAAALPPTSVVGDGFDVSLSGVGGEGDAAEVGYDQSNAASNTSATNGAEAEAGGIVFGSGEVEVPLKNLANRSSNENGWAGWWNRQQYNQQQQPQLQQQQQQEQQKE